MSISSEFKDDTHKTVGNPANGKRRRQNLIAQENEQFSSVFKNKFTNIDVVHVSKGPSSTPCKDGESSSRMITLRRSLSSGTVPRKIEETAEAIHKTNKSSLTPMLHNVMSSPGLVAQRIAKFDGNVRSAKPTEPLSKAETQRDEELSSRFIMLKTEENKEPKHAINNKTLQNLERSSKFVANNIENLIPTSKTTGAQELGNDLSELLPTSVMINPGAQPTQVTLPNYSLSLENEGVNLSSQPIVLNNIALFPNPIELNTVESPLKPKEPNDDQISAKQSIIPTLVTWLQSSAKIVEKYLAELLARTLKNKIIDPKVGFITPNCIDKPVTNKSAMVLPREIVDKSKEMQITHLSEGLSPESESCDALESSVQHTSNKLPPGFLGYNVVEQSDPVSEPVEHNVLITPPNPLLHNAVTWSFTPATRKSDENIWSPENTITHKPQFLGQVYLAHQIIAQHIQWLSKHQLQYPFDGYPPTPYMQKENLQQGCLKEDYSQNNQQSWCRMSEQRIQPQWQPDKDESSMKSKLDAKSRNWFIIRVTTLVLLMLISTGLFLYYVIRTPEITICFRKYGLLGLIGSIMGLLFLNYWFLCCTYTRCIPYKLFLCLLALTCMSCLAAVLATRFKTEIVIYAVISTACIALICAVLANTTFDVTTWYFYVVNVAAVLSASGIALFIGMKVTGNYMKPIHFIVLMVSVVLQGLLSMIEIQITAGDKTIKLGDDDWVLGAFMLYTSNLDIFVKFIQPKDVHCWT